MLVWKRMRERERVRVLELALALELEWLLAWTPHQRCEASSWLLAW